MIYDRHLHRLPRENGDRDAVSIRHRELAGRVAALMERVSTAKRAADESLSRTNDAPQPHGTSNTIFVALYDARWRDREALFEAMRQLDAAREALRSIAAEMIATGTPTTPGERPAG